MQRSPFLLRWAWVACGLGWLLAALGFVLWGGGLLVALLAGLQNSYAPAVVAVIVGPYIAAAGLACTPVALGLAIVDWARRGKAPWAILLAAGVGLPLMAGAVLFWIWPEKAASLPGPAFPAPVIPPLAEPDGS